MKNHTEQYQYTVKIQQIQKNIRGQQLHSKFSSERRHIGQIGNKKTIQQKNYQKLRQLIQIGDPFQIYEALTPITNDMISALDRLALEIVKLCIKKFDNKDGLRLMSIIIMYCYEALRDYLAEINFFDEILNKLYEAIANDDQERITLLLLCIRNMASRKYDIIDYQKFAQRHLFILFDKLKTYPHFMVFVTFTAEATNLQLDKFFPALTQNVLNPQENLVIKIASISAIIHLIARSDYQPLKPFVNILFSCFRQTFYGKNLFNLTNKFRSVDMMKRLLDMIPQEDYNQFNMQAQFKKITTTINYMKDLQRLDLVQLSYKLFWEIAKKSFKIGEHYWTIFFQNDTLQLLNGGLTKGSQQINQIVINTISFALNEIPQEYKFVYKLTSTDFIKNLQKITDQRNREMRNKAENLLNLINQTVGLDQQL